MDHEFWLERWRNDQLGWHLADTNPLLASYWAELGITQGSAVFVPLCGKSLDMRYLESLGHQVVGVELSEAAILAYFREGDEGWRRDDGFYLGRFSGSKSAIYCGDFFDLSASDILGIRAVYDRGALIALPPDSRAMYADHMLRVIPEHAHILLITLDYDQQLIAGPPFAVSEAEVNELYSPRCRVSLVGDLVTADLPPRFKEAGVDSAREMVYHIIKDK